MGTIGKLEKNRPERSFELGHDRVMTTTGLEKGVTLRLSKDRFTTVLKNYLTQVLPVLKIKVPLLMVNICHLNILI